MASSNRTNRSTTKTTTINSSTNNQLLVCTSKWRPSRARKRDRILAKFPATQASTIRFCTRCHTPTSIAPMCQPRQACMRTSRLAARRTTCATMGAKATREPRSCARMERFSIRRSSRAIGGTTWIVARRRATTSENMIFSLCSMFLKHKPLFSCFSLNADPEHNPYFPKKKPEEEHKTHDDFHIQL